jgi:hypothetical protein
MQTLSFEPLIPPALWLTLAVGALVLLAWYGRRRPDGVRRWRWAGILTLACVGLVLLLLLLLNPTWVDPIVPPNGKPLLTVLVDATASMATPDAGDGKTRFQSATALAKVCAERLSDRYEVRVATFTDTLKPSDAAALETNSPEGGITDLSAALTESLVENGGQGQVLMLFSDGIHNGGGGSASVLEAVRLARALGTPVYTRTLGRDPEIRDVAVEFRSPQEVAYIGQKVSVTALLRQRGYTGASVRLVLSVAGEDVERRPVALQQEATEVRFDIGQDKPGLYRYELRSEPLKGEASLTNNTATLLLRVMDKPVRVLLLEGKPYWDAKFLTRTLLSDASVELDSVVRLSENRLLRRTFRRDEEKATTTREEWQIVNDVSETLSDPQALKTYQVVLLGRDADSFLTDPALAQLRTWLSRDGGALVCSRGQPTSQVNQRLGQLLPVRWVPANEARFRVHLTERGRDLRWFPQVGRESSGAALAQLPPLASSSRAEHPKPLAVVLATARAAGSEVEDPVVSYQPYGTGRVVVIEGSGMWRWAFLPPTQQQHDDVYRSLWRGLMRWLIASGDLLPGQKMLLRSDRVTFGTTEPATATLLLREDEGERKQTPLVELRGDGVEGVRSVTPVPLGEEPGTFRVAFGKLPEGRYQIRVAGTQETDAATNAAFDVRSLSEEQLDLKARPDLMARIAQESGGAVLEGASPGEMLAQFTKHREQSRPARVQRLTAWDRWWVLLAVVGLWGSTWLLRRRGGLV